MIVGVLLLIACVACWLRYRRRGKNAEPPLFPGAWPIVGHAPLLIGDCCHMWNVITKVTNKSYEYGGAITFNIGPKTVYCITDPDDLYTVAVTCLEKDSFYSFAKPWLGDGLLTAKYTVWNPHYKLLHPAFSQIFLATIMDVFNTKSKELVKAFEEKAGKGLFDSVIYTRQIGLESISKTSLGLDFMDSNLSNEYMDTVEQYFTSIVERLVKFWWHSRHTFAWSKLKKTQDSYLKILHNMSNTVLQQKKSEISRNTSAARKSETKFKPFIDILLELSAEKGAFTDEQIRAHVDTMLVAGHESSSFGLMYIFVMLGSYPEVQEKVFFEIQEVVGEARDVEKADLSKLTYMEAVMKETMRMYPIAPVVARQIDRDVKLKNYTLLSGRSCLLILAGLHQHPMWGPDRHEFKPERWLEPGKRPNNPNLFAPFSLGKRQCIGKAYAMMSLKTTLVHVVRNYRIRADHTKMRLQFAVLLRPDNDGSYISIEKRT